MNLPFPTNSKRFGCFLDFAVVSDSNLWFDFADVG
jgi:hypothetical protein